MVQNETVRNESWTPGASTGGGKKHRHRGKNGGRRFCRAAATLLLFLPFITSAAHAVEIRSLLGVRDYTLGSGVYLPDSMIRPADTAGRTFAIGIHELTLYGIDALSLSALRLSYNRGRAAAALSLAQLNTPVGSERMAGVEIGAAGDRLSLRVLLDYQRVQLDAFEPDAMLRYRLQACVTVGRSVAAGYTVGAAMVNGEQREGIDLSAFIHTAIHARAGWYGYVMMRQESRSAIGTGIMLHPAGRVQVIVGYDDASELLKGMLSVEFARMSVRIGSGIHPLLGVTSGVSLVWEV